MFFPRISGYRNEGDLHIGFGPTIDAPPYSQYTSLFYVVEPRSFKAFGISKASKVFFGLRPLRFSKFVLSIQIRLGSLDDYYIKQIEFFQGFVYRSDPTRLWPWSLSAWRTVSILKRMKDISVIFGPDWASSTRVITVHYNGLLRLLLFIYLPVFETCIAIMLYSWRPSTLLNRNIFLFC